MLKLEKLVVDMDGTLTKSKSEMLLETNSKAVRVSEEMEADHTHGKFLKENTSAKFFTGREVGWMA